MVRILLTGFEPFGKSVTNVSWEVAAAVGLQQFPKIDLCTALLPVSFNRVRTLLSALIEEHRPDVLLMLGQASKREEITIERIAVNMMDASQSDNDGYIPREERIIEDGGNAYFTDIPLSTVCEEVSRMGIPCKISNTAGLYVCNTAFYTALHYAHEQERELKVGFVHLPSKGLELELMVKGVKKIIQTIVIDEENR